MIFIESMTSVFKKLNKDNSKESIQEEIDKLQEHIKEQYLTGSVLFLPEAENKIATTLNEFTKKRESEKYILDTLKKINQILLDFSSYKIMLIKSAEKNDADKFNNAKNNLENLLKELLSLLSIDKL